MMIEKGDSDRIATAGLQRYSSGRWNGASFNDL
jgi:hypothetical protein